MIFLNIFFQCEWRVFFIVFSLFFCMSQVFSSFCAILDLLSQCDHFLPSSTCNQFSSGGGHVQRTENAKTPPLQEIFKQKVRWALSIREPIIFVTLRYKFILQFPGHFGDQNDREEVLPRGFLAFALLRILSCSPASGSICLFLPNFMLKA